MRLIKKTLAKPEVRTALVSFGKVCLDRCLECAIMKLRDFEERLKNGDNVVDVEFEVIDDAKKM